VEIATESEPIIRTCDVCGESTRVGGEASQHGTLQADWGAGSSHEGESYLIRLCEHCFFRTLAGLKRDRMVNHLFNANDTDSLDFGRVLRSQPSEEEGG